MSFLFVSNYKNVTINLNLQGIRYIIYSTKFVNVQQKLILF